MTTPVHSSSSTSTPVVEQERDRKKSQQEASGCEVPFVPVTTSQFSRFKQLSTRRQKDERSSRTTSSPNLRQQQQQPQQQQSQQQQPYVGLTQAVHAPVTSVYSAPPPQAIPPDYAEHHHKELSLTPSFDNLAKSGGDLVQVKFNEGKTSPPPTTTTMTTIPGMYSNGGSAPPEKSVGGK